MKLKIGAKISGGYIVMLILLSALGAYSFISTGKMSKDIDQVDILNQHLALQGEIEAEFLNSTAGIRGYIAYGTENHRDNFIHHMTNTIDLARQLADFTDNEKREQVQELIDISTEYFQGISAELLPAVERQYASQTLEEMEERRAEVVAIAGQYIPLTERINEINHAMVVEDTANRDNYLGATTRLMAGIQTQSVAVTAIAMVIGGLLSIFITRAVKNPMVEMAAGANRLAQGDFTQKINVGSDDEIGDLARSLNEMSDQLANLISEVSNNAQVVAAQSEEMAAASEEVNSSVEEVANTASQVAATAEKSFEKATLAVKESEDVELLAQEGNETVQDTIEKINAIAKATTEVELAIKALGRLSGEIGNITDLISDIAEQTNLLALNAAIEAARAGEAGRGFAVVAEEVRKLAEQSADATRDINELVKQVQIGVDTASTAMENGTVQVQEGVQLASEAGKALNSIYTAVKESIQLVKDMAEGAKQSSMGMEQVAASNEQITSTVQQVTGASQELAGIANQLQLSVERFKI
ncbi:methyl-accepting chemotaxis protein [Desulfofalx alkaliphila]|uniref:methyl-accepting chemotaxis protein n=1 Tax=Desulfofalx alkaliphila TaxID=105483 RepID=UPI00068B39B0|nr:methyl-accepting chemotaxis protein [Desulfofalx alkaliphila]